MSNAVLVGRDEPFSWVSVLGYTIIKEIIEEIVPQWPNGPRATQVECWAHTMSKRPVLLVASTGWGKTAAFFGPILILRHLLRRPNPQVPKPPPHPVAVVVTPLIELGNAHAAELSGFGLRAISLNAETLRAASDEGRNLMKEIKACKWDIVFISAERLISKDFNDVLRDDFFRLNFAVFGLDEGHTVEPWGKEFRESYKHIGPLLRRIPSHTATVTVTATLSHKDELSLCSHLGYNVQKNEIHRIRLSSERPNIRLIFKELQHTLSSHTFPDIAWAFQSGRKVVIYCATIDLCFRVAFYGWTQYPSDDRRRLDKVRLWTSITSSSYNQNTLDLFAHYSECSVIVATIAFGMGMNIRNITDSVNLGLPSSLSVVVQQNGRAGRDFSIEARGWTFIEPNLLSALRHELKVEGPAIKGANTKSSSRLENIEDDLKRCLVAHVLLGCLHIPVNHCMGNSSTTSLLSCHDAQRSLPCSTCEYYEPPPIITSSSSTQLLDTNMEEVDKTPPVAPAFKPFTKAVQENAALWLQDFGETRWARRTDVQSAYLPSVMFWSGTSISVICSSLHLLRSREIFDKELAKWENLATDGDELWEMVKVLIVRLDEHVKLTNEARSKKTAETRARNQGDCKSPKGKQGASASSATPNFISKPYN